MHLSKAQLDEEEAQYKSIETYVPLRVPNLMMESGTTSNSLLPYLSYIPSERNQGSCGDCWVWASTGVLEIDHTIKTGINERLSTQYFNSKYEDGQGDSYACCGGNLQIFTSWYNNDKTPIPWSNTNASFGDRGRTCGSTTAVPIGTISTTPHYQLNSISYSTVWTKDVGQSTAIANIKSAIDNNKALYYSFHYGSKGWSAFNYNWSHQAESVIFDPDSYGGEADAGGHGVVIVGYDTSGPDPYWVVLNSWGTTSGRPNGLFRLKMNMNYDNTYGSSLYTQHKFYVLDSTYKTLAPTVTGITPATGLNTTSVSIANLAGTNFNTTITPTVKLNRTGYADITATGVTVINSSAITCTLPITYRPSGQWNIVVTNPDGQAGMKVSGFTITAPTIIPPPTVTGITPNSGPIRENIPITIRGTNFVSGGLFGVKIDGVTATNVVRINATTITAETPAGNVGAKTVAVINNDGQTATKASGFTYVAPPIIDPPLTYVAPPGAYAVPPTTYAALPTISSITPDSGPTKGNTPITISGTNFVSGGSFGVKISGVAATNVSRINATAISASTPANPAGPRTVAVINNDGKTATKDGGFTYQ